MPSFLFSPLLSLWSRYVNLAAGPTCNVAGDTSDDTNAIKNAFNDCSAGGLVVLDKSYILGSPLNTTNLTNVDVQFSGTITLNPDIAFWKNNAFNLTFQDASTAWLIGGNNIRIFGGGIFNGSGDMWYGAGVNGPVPWTIVNSSTVLVDNIRVDQSPYWHNFIVNSTDVRFSNMNLHSVGGNGASQSNTDGFGVLNNSRVTITNSVVVSGGECVSLKANSTDIRIENMVCQGSKAITMGPIGSNPGEQDVIRSVFVKNATMLYTEAGARVQVFGSGRGSGYVSNVTFQDIRCSNCDIPIVIDQCYQATNCASNPPRVLINDIHFDTVTGTGSRDQLVVSIACVDVQTGTSQYFCKNVNSLQLLDFPCSDGTAGIGSYQPPSPPPSDPLTYTFSTGTTVIESERTSYSTSKSMTSTSTSTTTTSTSTRTTSKEPQPADTTSKEPQRTSITTKTSQEPKSTTSSDKSDSDQLTPTTTPTKPAAQKQTPKSSSTDKDGADPTKAKSTPTPTTKRPPKDQDPSKTTPYSTPKDPDSQDPAKAKSAPTKPPNDADPPKTTPKNDPPAKDSSDGKQKATPSKRWADELDLY